MRVGIVGMGAMGQAVARALCESPAASPVRLVAVSSRRPEVAETVAAAISPGSSRVTAVSRRALAAHADVVLLAVGDPELEAVAASITWGAEHLVLHLSGAQTLAPLTPASLAGADVGSLHPMVSIPRPRGAEAAPTAAPTAPQLATCPAQPDAPADAPADVQAARPSPFVGAVAAVDGAPTVQPALKTLAAALGLRPVPVPSEWRAQWHAAATMVGNTSTALVSHAEQLLATVPMDAALRRQALAGLLQSVANNLSATPHDAAIASQLTGPIARGDVATVARHLAHLPQSSRASYHHAARLVLLAASEQLPESTRDAIATLLSASTPT